MSDCLWTHRLYSPPGSSNYGIFQARILEWVSIYFSQESFQPTDWTQVSHTAGRLFTVRATMESPSLYYYPAKFEICTFTFFVHKEKTTANSSFKKIPYLKNFLLSFTLIELSSYKKYISSIKLILYL